jgi:alpha-L-fucosidase 2
MIHLKTICVFFFANMIIGQSIKTKSVEWNVSQYDEIWNSPSQNALGSMPLGNGDMGINVWVEPGGDLMLLLGKSDSFDEFNRLLKIGCIRIKTTPSIYKEGQAFSQRLNLADGSIEIKTETSKLRIWVDANHPLVQVDFTNNKPVDAKVIIENWRKAPRELEGSEKLLGGGNIKEKHSLWGNWPDKAKVYADTILPSKEGQLAWCHHNVESQWQRNLELTGLSSEIVKGKDPVLNRNFGAIVRGGDMKAVSKTELQTKKTSKAFSVQIFMLTNQSESIQDWLKATEKLANGVKTSDERFVAHQTWWHQFWNRSKMEVTSSNAADNSAFVVSKAYNLQRFVTACAGRGNLPIKFNGSLFTVEGVDPDYRSWGGGYWFQNTRLAYYPMLACGDYDMMLPVFDMYMKALTLRKAATKNYYGHEGAFFPETIYFWGNYMDNENYGIDRQGKADGYTENTFIRYYWQSGIEMVGLMLDYYDATQDKEFLSKTLLPFGTEIMKFYDQHWKRGTDGKILFDPSQSLETWHVAVNPTPEIVGIRYIGNRLLALTNEASLKSQWQKTINDLPAVPMIAENGKTRILPAEKFSKKSNIENPELYAVFPYKVYTCLSDEKTLEIGRNTWEKRVHPEDKGWQQNCIQAALLGLADESQKMVIERAKNKAAGYRFIGFFGPNYDWTPEQCHGTNMMTALQFMIMQCEGDKIVLLPAWNKGWNVNFKLNAPKNTVIEGRIENGTVKDLKVFPESRRKDMEIKECK